jgi:DNA-directed RNA polymerase subunit RPC12/RpoP
MTTLASSRQKKFYQRGTVHCAKCAAPIYVYKLKALPEEFSVRCAQCGAREVYSNRAVTIFDLPERRKKPRK